MKENETLEQKLTWTQERLKSFATDKDMNWLNSMLDFCKYILKISLSIIIIVLFLDKLPEIIKLNENCLVQRIY